MPLMQTYLNGKPATTEDLAPLVFAGFAHFTAMQVRDRAVHGLDLHLRRLRGAGAGMFGHHLPDDRLTDLLGSAIAETSPDASLTCYITSSPGEFTAPDGKPSLDVVIKVTDPVTPDSAPLALDVARHERHLPHIKHVGEVAKTLYLRRARSRGFDDAVFLDGAGRLSEATIWNLVFFDGDTVIWPEADVLDGVTQQVLRRQLDAAGVSQAHRPMRLGDLEHAQSDGLSAAVMNSWTPGIGIARIGDGPLADSRDLTDLLHRGYAAELPIAL